MTDKNSREQESNNQTFLNVHGSKDWMDISSAQQNEWKDMHHITENYWRLELRDDPKAQKGSKRWDTKRHNKKTTQKQYWLLFKNEHCLSILRKKYLRPRNLLWVLGCIIK